jgi:hypothetical protein
MSSRSRLNYLLSYLAGYDIFISYSRRDAASYAAMLANELAARNFSCHLDQWGAQPGAAVPGEMLRAVRRCKLFVLIGSSGGSSSAAVECEIREFLKTGRFIVPVDLDGSIWTASWWPLINGLAIANEARSDSGTQPSPSIAVIDRIEKTATFTKRNTSLRVWAAGALVSFCVLTVLVGLQSRKLVVEQKKVFGVMSNLARLQTEAQQLDGSLKRANRERLEAEDATLTARKQRKIEEILSRSVEDLDIDPERSILLALQATRLAPDPTTPEGQAARSQLHRSIISSRVRLQISEKSDISAASWQSNDTRIALATRDGNVQIYSSKTSKLLFRFSAKTDGPLVVSWSPDGHFAATAGRDNIVRLWDASNGRYLKDLAVNVGVIRALAWNPTSSFLAIGGGSICVFSIKTSTCSPHQKGLGSVHLALCLAWSHDGNSLAIGSQDWQGYIWNRITDKMTAHFGGRDFVRSVAWSPDDRQIASDDFFQATVWNASTGTSIRSFPSLHGYVVSLSWSPVGDTIAVASDTAAVWDVNTGAQVFQVRGHEGYVTEVAWNTNGTRLLKPRCGASSSGAWARS